MNAHRLAEQRSLSYHTVIAERLHQEPQLLEAARQRVKAWLSEQSDPPAYAHMWSQVLARGINSIAVFMVERSEVACELRQSSPFAGALPPRERWRIWRETRERFLEHA